MVASKSFSVVLLQAAKTYETREPSFSAFDFEVELEGRFRGTESEILVRVLVRWSKNLNNIFVLRSIALREGL